ncbi:MAG TPA: DUF6766 family protein [Polyangia bacterium]
MKRVLRDNGLSIALFALFLASLLGQSLTGWREHNDEQRDHNRAAVSYGQYLTSGDFLEATFENWESEFMQMAAFLVLSAVLIQRGAAESKKPPEEEEEERKQKDEEEAPEGESSQNGHPPADAPWPVHRGGLVLVLYKRSLSLVLSALFLVSFVAHGLGGQAKYNDEAIAHGQPTMGLIEYMTSARFWFESFQNWQSEFLSVGVLVVLSIFLRQSGSPESKPVEAPHSQTGTE